LRERAAGGRPLAIVSAALTGLGATVAHSRSLAVVGALVTLGLPYAARARAAARRDAVARAELPSVLTAIAVELRAGRTVPAAFAAAAADASPELRSRLLAARDALEHGADAAAALTSGDDPAVGGLRPLAALLALAGSGARLAGLVERLAAAARADTRVRDAVRAELAGPTASAGLLAALPLLGLVLAAGTGADPIAALTGSALGVGCLLAGVALDAAGLLWARQIVRSVAGER
jgi:tight adherence protein B